MCSDGEFSLECGLYKQQVAAWGLLSPSSRDEHSAASTWIRHHRIPEISNKGAAEEFAYKGYAEHSTEITTENAKRGSSQGPRGPFDIVESEIQDIYYTCIRAKEKEKGEF